MKKIVRRSTTGIVKHAYGSTIQSKWNGVDYTTAGMDTASGALSGVATGAALGSIVPGIGTAVGAVVGGAIGLIKGISGSNAKSKQRAALMEQNRQQTIQNMSQRSDADAIEQSNMNSSMKPINFYMRGGRMFANGGRMNGIQPISHDTQLAIGPSHEQGGISAGPNDEVEGGETMKQQGNQTLVFSDRITIPNTKLTFAQASLPLMEAKAKFEKKFAYSEKDIADNSKILNTPTTDALKAGTLKRRSQISAKKSEDILMSVGMIDQQLNQLFALQEKLNGNADKEESVEESEQQLGYGGKIQHADGDSYITPRVPEWMLPDRHYSSTNNGMFQQTDVGYITDNLKSAGNESLKYINPDRLTSKSNSSDVASPKTSGISPGLSSGLQLGADALDTISQTITSNQMSKLPVPTKYVTKAPRFNTYVDNSAEISDINSGFKQTSKFLRDNTSNPAVRRAYMMQLNNSTNLAKGKSYLAKNAMERDLENKNVQMAFENTRESNQTMFDNSMNKYNAAMAGLTRQSQLTADFSNKIKSFGDRQEQQNYNDISFGSMMSQYPEGVRRSIMQGMNRGRGLRNSIYNV